MGKIVTFYSYKGGVGRTMAVANVAVALAAYGKRVLAVDWDLEAPGLDKFFRSFTVEPPRHHGGLLSLIEGVAESEPRAWRDYASTVRLSPTHRLTFLSSGIGSIDYESRILDLNWIDFYQKGGGTFLEAVREDWEEKFDIVLIDSRTGLTDAGGICTIQMPDILVVVFTATEQSIVGVRDVALRARKGRHKLPYPRMAMPVLPLISRWDGQAEEKEGEEWMERIEREMKEFLGLWVPTDASRREVLETLRVPHSPFFSFGEKVPVIAQESLSDDQKPADKYFNVAALLLNHDWSKLADGALAVRKSVEKMRRSVGASGRRRVFLSAVSSEFAKERDLLTKSLLSLGIEVLSHESFGASHLTTVAALNSTIADCDAVIHLVGADLGACPEPRVTARLHDSFPEFDRRLSILSELTTSELHEISFTQWEYYLARYNSVPTYCFVADYMRNERSAVESDANALQVRHLRKILSASVSSVFRSPEELLIRVQAVLKMRRPHNLPYASIGNMFKGRVELLGRLFPSPHGAVVTSTTAINGLGGVGKTRLAIEFGWRFLSEHSATLFVTADSPESFERNFASLAGPLVLDLPESEDRDQQVQVAAVIRWLESHSGWLMIIDNVDDERTAQVVESLTARLSSGRILITSRLSRWPSNVTRCSLDVLDLDASVAFLLERTARDRSLQADDEAVALEIAKDLDGLPLALEHAAAYICELGLSFPEYRERWESRRERVLSWLDSRSSSSPQSLSVVWETTFEVLSSDARALLEHLAWLSPEPIPGFLFDDLNLEDIWSDLTECSDVRSSLAQLLRYSLIQRSDQLGDTPSWVIHRLVQVAVQQRIEETERTSRIKGTLRVLDASYAGDPNDVRTWGQWTCLAPHCVAIAEHADREGIADPTAKILSNTAQFLSARALYSEAEGLMRRALAIEESVYGWDHPEVARNLNNLAALLHSTNRLGEAEPLMRRALAIDEAANAPDHPYVAIRLNNLAQLLQATNRLSEAEPLMRRALAIDQASYGADHPDVATDLNNLAQLLYATNRFAEAEPLMLRALEIDEASYGPDHPNVAMRLNNLAQLLQATNRLSEAEPLLYRTLHVFESCFGPMHPNTSMALSNLAQLLTSTGRLAEAEQLLRRSLYIDESTYGSNHPRVATGLNNLAQLLTATKRFEEAELLLRRSFEIEVRSLGAEHPSVAVRLNNLAQLLASTGRHVEAEPLARQSVEILSRFAKDTGQTHPHLMVAVRNFASVLSAMGSDKQEVSARLNALLTTEGFATLNDIGKGESGYTQLLQNPGID